MHGLTMPPEWARHERTLMGWPVRRELWGSELAAAKVEYAAVANAVAAFEPVTMVVATAADAQEARRVLDAAVELVTLPIDDSWLRDCGPLYVVDDVRAPRRRVATHWDFNAWGERFTPFAADAALGGLLARRLGDEVVTVPMVLEGGSVHVDGEGRLVTTEQCLLHPSRNPTLDRAGIEGHLRDALGVREVVWLGKGLVEDRDTDGHVDLVAAFTAPGRLLLQSTAPGTPDHEAMAANADTARAAGLEVVDFPLLAHTTVAGRRTMVSYMNFYLGDRFAVVPQAGAATDAEAVERLAAALPGHEVVGVPGATLAFGGGGPHCITQQMPALAG